MSVESSERGSSEVGFIPLGEPAQSYSYTPFAWLRGGRRVAVGEGVQLRIHGLDGGILGASEPLGGEPIGELAPSPCGRWIAVATDGDTIDRHRVVLLDIASGEVRGVEGEQDARIDLLRWSPTGETLVSVGDDLMIWEAEGGALVRRAYCDVPLRFSGDGLRIARIHEDFFEVLDLRDPRADRQLPRRRSWRHVACWWDLPNAASSPQIELHSDGPRTLTIWGVGELPPFARTLTWAPDRPLAIAEGDRHGMLLVRPEEREPVVLSPFHDRTVEAIAWSADGARIASGGRARRVFLWSRDGAWLGERSADFGEEPLRRGLRGQITGLAWSPTGSHLAVREHGGLRIWGATTPREGR